MYARCIASLTMMNESMYPCVGYPDVLKLCQIPSRMYRRHKGRDTEYTKPNILTNINAHICTIVIRANLLKQNNITNTKITLVLIPLS